jgi:hypothetical protein
MKTSNKILLLATLIILSYLTFFDFKLKAEYLKGEYKTRFYSMKEQKVGEFRSIENNASNLDVRIEKGDQFEIWYDDDLKDNLELTNKNNQLVINYNKKDNEDDFIKSGNLIIICPKIEAVAINKVLKMKDSLSKEYIPNGVTTIYNFNQDKLELIVNSVTELILDKNKFNLLSAKVGDSKSTNGTLTILNNNEINNLYVELNGTSILNLNDPMINKAELKISDSVDVKLSGRALKFLKINQ